MMATSGSLTGFFIPQWLAAIATAIGGMGLARIAGFKPAAAMLGGLIYLTSTNVIFQMGIPSNDLLTAIGAIGFLYFALRAIQLHTPHKLPWPELAYAGLGIGLALGSKYTILFLLPGAGVVLTVYAVLRHRQAAILLLVALGSSALIGFILFGSYNYVLNYLNFGNPITSRSIDAASSTINPENRENFYGLGANLPRYLYQIADWNLITDTNDHPLYVTDIAIHRWVQQTFNLTSEAEGVFEYESSSGRNLAMGSSGYGLIVYVATLLSPLILGVYLWRARTASRYGILALLITISWLYLMTFSLVSPYSPFKQRYFHVFMPALIAAIFPWLYAVRRVRVLWLLPIMIFVLLSSIQTVQQVKAVSENLRDNIGTVNPAEAQRLQQILPPDSRIGIMGRLYYAFGLIDQLPQYGYTNVSTTTANQLLESGEIQAVVGTEDTCRHGWPQHYAPSRLFIGIYCMLLPDPNTFIDEPIIMNYYGSRLADTDADRFVQMEGSDLLVRQQNDRITVHIPTHLMEPLAGDLRIELRNDQGGLDIEQVTCNDTPTTLTLADNQVFIEFPEAAFAPDYPFQTCIMQKQVAEYSRFVNQQMWVYPTQTPAPDHDPDLIFAGELSLLATHLAQYEVLACDYLYVGTWWQMDAPVSTDYRITTVLAGANGVGQARDDGRLGETAISEFAPNTSFMDRRFIPIPCDLEPGSYDLLLGLYAPDDLEGIPITLPDATPMGNLAYLTTITVKDS
jgi:hypothetical protein